MRFFIFIFIAFGINNCLHAQSMISKNDSLQLNQFVKNFQDLFLNDKLSEISNLYPSKEVYYSYLDSMGSKITLDQKKFKNKHQEFLDYYKKDIGSMVKKVENKNYYNKLSPTYKKYCQTTLNWSRYESIMAIYLFSYKYLSIDKLNWGKSVFNDYRVFNSNENSARQLTLNFNDGKYNGYIELYVIRIKNNWQLDPLGQYRIRYEDASGWHGF